MALTIFQYWAMMTGAASMVLALLAAVVALKSYRGQSEHLVRFMKIQAFQDSSDRGVDSFGIQVLLLCKGLPIPEPRLQVQKRDISVSLYPYDAHLRKPVVVERMDRGDLLYFRLSCDPRRLEETCAKWFSRSDDRMKLTLMSGPTQLQTYRQGARDRLRLAQNVVCKWMRGKRNNRFTFLQYSHCSLRYARLGAAQDYARAANGELLPQIQMSIKANRQETVPNS